MLRISPKAGGFVPRMFGVNRAFLTPSPSPIEFCIKPPRDGRASERHKIIVLPRLAARAP